MSDRFDPHDPEIESMMWERAHAQGAAHNAETVLGTRVIIGSAVDLTAVREAIQEFVGAFEKAMVSVAEVINSYGSSLTEFARKVAEINEPAQQNRRRHGAAAICPRHGPTRGGTCRECHR